MPKIKKKNKIEQCTKIFIYRVLKWSLTKVPEFISLNYRKTHLY